MVTPNDTNLPVQSEESAVQRAGERGVERVGDRGVERAGERTVQRAGERGVEPFTGTPLGTEFENTDSSLDPLAGAEVGKRFSSGFMLIGIVVVIAVAGLFSMRKLAKATAGIGIDARVEETIEGFLEALSGGDNDPSLDQAALRKGREEALHVIGGAYNELQVPLQDVQRDPFILDGSGKVVMAPRNDGDAVGARLARERKKILAAGETLSLKSIVGGDTKMALINKAIVRTGETVASASGDVEFRVEEIHNTSVDLIAEVPELDLSVTVTVHLNR